MERFESMRVHRNQLTDAPYNPRNISPVAKAKLKLGIKKLGLLAPITWNKRTGHIVGGHQRISIMDSIQGSKDYYLDVAAVDLDEKAEREANLLMNNPEAQGDWDMEKLEEMVRWQDDEGRKMDFDATGLDQATVYVLFGEGPLQSEQLQDLAESLRERREQYEQSFEKANPNDWQYYVCLVFAYPQERKDFLEAFGMLDDNFMDGNVFAQVIQDKVREAQVVIANRDAEEASAE